MTVVVIKPTSEVIDVMTEPSATLEFMLPEGSCEFSEELPGSGVPTTTSGVSVPGAWVGEVTGAGNPANPENETKTSVDAMKIMRKMFRKSSGFMVFPNFHKIEITDSS
jgi:hypothetical protein